MGLEYHTWTYDGPVLEYGICIDQHWTASTYAPSERKARNNLAARYKNHHNRAMHVKIELPGKFTKEE